MAQCRAVPEVNGDVCNAGRDLVDPGLKEQNFIRNKVTDFALGFPGQRKLKWLPMSGSFFDGQGDDDILVVRRLGGLVANCGMRIASRGFSIPINV